MGKKTKAGITRRQFCGVSILGAACLVNMDTIAMAAEKKQEEMNADLVIIGAGGGGLTAAVSAYEAGIKNIIVLEKTAKPGGNTTNVGVFFAVNSPLQKRLGIKATAEQAFRDKMAHDHWRQNGRLIRDTIEKSGEVLQWLEDKGLVRHRQIGKKYVFAPKTPHRKASRSALRNLLTTFFNGSIEEAVASLLDLNRDELGDDELERLAKLIADARKEGE